MTPNETQALKAVSEKFMLGDLLKVLMGEIRLLSVPWGALPEKEQQKVINSITETTEKAVRQCVDIIAGKARPTVSAEIDSVLFKDGVKVTLTFNKSAGDPPCHCRRSRRERAARAPRLRRGSRWRSTEGGEGSGRTRMNALLYLRGNA